MNQEQFPAKPEDISQSPQQVEKRPHFITARLLDVLGGKKVDMPPAGKLIEKGAYLWGIEGSEAEDRDRGKGILNHVLLVSRVAYTLGKLVQEKKVPGFENINLQSVVEAALLHDVDKLWGEEREKLPSEIKEALGLSPDFKELSDASDKTAGVWLTELGFSPEVIEGVKTHQDPDLGVKNPYWCLIVLSDYMASQRVMTVKERLQDIRARWIDNRVKNGELPRMSEEEFQREIYSASTAYDAVLGPLGMTDEEVIETYKLNSPEGQTRWEKFLRFTKQSGKEERAKKLFKHITHEF